MESTMIYFLAQTCVFAFVLCAIVVFSRRKERSVTLLKGVFVFLIAWLGGTIGVLLMHTLFAAGGIQVAGGQLETPIAVLVVLPMAFAAYNWLSQPIVGR